MMVLLDFLSALFKNNYPHYNPFKIFAKGLQGVIDHFIKALDYIKELKVKDKPAEITNIVLEPDKGHPDGCCYDEIFPKNIDV